MLTPEYLDQMTDDILAMYDALNESIVEDIARRIVKADLMTETAAWQAKQLQAMGMLYDDIIERVSQISGYTESELQKLFSDAGVENIRYENDIMEEAGLHPIELKQSEEMMKLLQAGIDKTGRDLSNLTLTTAIRAQDAYYNAVNLAYMQVSSGTLSYQEAIKRAILSVAKEGASVLYPSGRSDKVDVAIRRAVLTGVNQTAAKMSEAYCDEAHCDYVETTAHSGARPDHEKWQGKVFCRSGKDKKYPPFSETGYGTGAGLCGWNCRHSFHAFFPGISAPAYTKAMLNDYKAKKYEYNGEKLTDYEYSQIQRGYERKIRETKRQLTACNAAMRETDDEALKSKLKMEFDDQSVRLKSQEKELRDFCKQTKRRVDSSRTQVYAVKDDQGRIRGFDRSVSQKAVWANRKLEEETLREFVEKASDSDIIKEKDKMLKMNLQTFAERDIKNQDSASLKRAIRKYQARIEEHEEKISNPAAIYPEWNNFDKRYQEGLKRHWNKEIRNFKQSIQNRIDELKSRGDYDE